MSNKTYSKQVKERMHSNKPNHRSYLRKWWPIALLGIWALGIVFITAYLMAGDFAELAQATASSNTENPQ